MPLPLLIIGPVLAATTAWGAVKTYKAGQRVKLAKSRYAERRATYESAERRHCERREHVQSRFRTLGEVRLRAMTTLGRAVEFLRKAKVKDRNLFEKIDLPEEQLAQWEGASIKALEVLGGIAASAASGAATAAAAYGLVGLLASASTGTAIATLSGVAASNATLAWLGGGTLAAGGFGVAGGMVVLGGLVFAPAVLVIGFVAAAQAEKFETEVARSIAEMDRAEAEMAKQLTNLGVVLKRVDEMEASTVKVDTALKELLSKCDPECLDDAYLVAKTAKSLGELLDTAILDKDGNPVPEE